MAHNKQGSNALPRRAKQDAEVIGGREFGNVIEPTQAEMASGNKGLAAEKPGKKKPAGKKAA